jgi:hypothetical protein
MTFFKKNHCRIHVSGWLRNCAMFLLALSQVNAGSSSTPEIVSAMPHSPSTIITSSDRADLVPLALDTDASYAWLSGLKGQTGTHINETHYDLTLTGEDRLTDSWVFQWAGITDSYQFQNIPSLMPDLLQFNALKAAVQYRVKSDTLFDLEIQPGWYSGANPSEGAFDAPITVFGVIPMTDQLSLTGGMYYSQLTKQHFYPLGGLVIILNPQWEIDLTDPDLSISYKINSLQKITFDLQEQVNGYQTSTLGRSPTRVVYDQSSAGFTYKMSFENGWSSSLALGWMLNRRIDLLKYHQSVNLRPVPFVELGLSKSF